MKYTKPDAPTNTESQDYMELTSQTGNLYQTVAILGRRANQINLELKAELDQRLEAFASHQDGLEEVFENREQIELSRYYETFPKPSLIALNELKKGEIYFRFPDDQLPVKAAESESTSPTVETEPQ